MLMLQRHKLAEDNIRHGERQLKAVIKYASRYVFNMSGKKKASKILPKIHCCFWWNKNGAFKHEVSTKNPREDGQLFEKVPFSCV